MEGKNKWKIKKIDRNTGERNRDKHVSKEKKKYKLNRQVAGTRRFAMLSLHYSFARFSI
jgi:hypothetical protein